MSDGKLPQGFGIAAALSSSVLHNCAKLNVFPELHDHQFHTTVDDNHEHSLIKLAASCYSRIKLFHPKSQEADVQADFIQSSVNQTVWLQHVTCKCNPENKLGPNQVGSLFSSHTKF